MKNTRVCIIYLLINKINGKVYVGQTWRPLKDRFGTNGKNYKACNYLYAAIEKYGWENFDHRKLTIELSQEGANAAEDFYIKMYKSRNPHYGYNIRGGGSTGQLSEETKKILSILNSGENNNFFGKTHTTESKQKVSENTKLYHLMGAYDLKNEEQKRFTDIEEREIVRLYETGTISIKDLLDKYNFSYTVFNKIREKFGLETILQPKSEEHIDKLKGNINIARQAHVKKAEENTLESIKIAVDLRKEGLLQKDIAAAMNITQVRVSQLLIQAGLRTETKRNRKKK
jgi:group I intron endonuclease